MTKKGWSGKSRRHGLAARRIKTNINDKQRLAVNNFVARGYYSDRQQQLEEKFNKLIEAMAERIQAAVGDDSVMNYSQALNISYTLARSGEMDGISQFSKRAEDAFYEIMENQEIEDASKPGTWIKYENKKWQVTGVLKDGTVILGRKGKKDESISLTRSEFSNIIL
jgi:hypothetical protein